MKNSLLVAFIVVSLFGCAKDPKEVTQSNNPNFKIELLFDYDGCKMYRFKDVGYHRYFSKCSNGNSEVSWMESCGKNCTRQVEIKTNKEI